MTVAALFVGMAFQAIVHPPDGMSFDHCTFNVFYPGLPPYRRKNAGMTTSDAPSPFPGADPDNLRAPYGWSGSCLYLFSITVTMAVALTMLVLLLTMKRAPSRFTLFFSYQRIALFYIKGMLASLALGVAASFIIGTSRDQGVQLTTLVYFLVYPLIASIGRVIMFYV
jgi:hypothetical protein